MNRAIAIVWAAAMFAQTAADLRRDVEKRAEPPRASKKTQAKGTKPDPLRTVLVEESPGNPRGDLAEKERYKVDMKKVPLTERPVEPEDLFASREGEQRRINKYLTLSHDTPIELRLRQTVSSTETRIHHRVDFDVTDDVRIDDLVAIPRGSPAWGVVTDSEPKNRMRRNGRLDIDLQGLCLPDGREVPLRSTRFGSMKMPHPDPPATDSVLALPALPIMLFIHGKDITIPKGREFVAYLYHDVQFNREFLGRDPATRCPPPEPEPLSGEETVRGQMGTVAIRSTPDTADILVNGKYMGQTPATVRLHPGEYDLQLTLPGKMPWERKVVVTPNGETNVTARLESIVYVQLKED